MIPGKTTEYGGITEIGRHKVKWSLTEEMFIPKLEELPHSLQVQISEALSEGVTAASIEGVYFGNYYEGWWSIYTEVDNREVYEVPTKFIFSGVFRVTANSQEQAEEFVLKHCGLVISGHIHSSLPSDEIEWEFNSHLEKEIVHE